MSIEFEFRGGSGGVLREHLRLGVDHIAIVSAGYELEVEVLEGPGLCGLSVELDIDAGILHGPFGQLDWLAGVSDEVLPVPLSGVISDEVQLRLMEGDVLDDELLSLSECIAIDGDGDGGDRGQLASISSCQFDVIDSNASQQVEAARAELDVDIGCDPIEVCSDGGGQHLIAVGPDVVDPYGQSGAGDGDQSEQSPECSGPFTSRATHDVLLRR